MTQDEPVRSEQVRRVASVAAAALLILVAAWCATALPNETATARFLWGTVAGLALAGGVGLGLRSYLTRRRAREEELARLSWRLEFALATAGIGVWDVDLATDHLIWDDHCRCMLGITDKRPYYNELDWLGVIHPEDRGRALSETNAAIQGNGRFRTDYRIVRPDGEIRHIRDTAALYTGEDGTRRLVGLIVDITEDVALQQELRERRSEAEAATLAKSRFLATMSHEIRTPLAGVLGLLGLMLEARDLSPEQKERATLALASAEQQLEILNDILDFSRLEAQQVRVAPEPVDIFALVRDIAALMTAAAERKGLQFRVEFASGLPERIMADPQKLRQILVNLASNAIKFTETGEVVVTVSHRVVEGRGRLRVAVSDTGIGISSAQADEIFEHFVQGDNSFTRKAGGTGLGLAISRQLAMLMGGEIGVESLPGQGSTFTFEILAPVVGGTVEIAARAPKERVRTARPMRLLLAEDNPTNQYVIGAVLRAQGHAVETVPNGVAAVAAAGSGRYDAILMDVHMPEMDGFAAASAIRILPGKAGQVPIVALTANAMSGDREACLAAGMSDYVSKPVDVATLHAVLARLQADAPPPEPHSGA